MRMLRDSATAVDGYMAPPLLVTPAPSASASAVAGRPALLPLPPAGTSNGGSGFHADMVIVLAAMLCVLVFALGLQALIRCALHCARHYRRSRALAAEAAAPPATPAAAAANNAWRLKKKSALALIGRIPEAVYEAEAGAPPGTECAICLGEFVGGDRVRLLPTCRHGFHVRCIDMWLSAHSSCPIFRHSLLDEGAAGVATGAGEEETQT